MGLLPFLKLTRPSCVKKVEDYTCPSTISSHGDTDYWTLTPWETWGMGTVSVPCHYGTLTISAYILGSFHKIIRIKKKG